MPSPTSTIIPLTVTPTSPVCMSTVADFRVISYNVLASCIWDPSWEGSWRTTDGEGERDVEPKFCVVDPDAGADGRKDMCGDGNASSVRRKTLRDPPIDKKNFQSQVRSIRHCMEKLKRRSFLKYFPSEELDGNRTTTWLRNDVQFCLGLAVEKFNRRAFGENA